MKSGNKDSFYAVKSSIINVWQGTRYTCLFRSSHLEMFLQKGVLKLCRKFTGEHSCRSAVSIKLQSNLIEITLRHGCSPVSLLHIFRTAFLKNNPEWLLPSLLTVGTEALLRRCSVKKDILTIFAMFTRKHLCWSLVLIKFIKKRLLHNCFHVSFVKFLRSCFFK